MTRVWELVAEFRDRCDGQDLVEYGLLAALIALIAFVAIGAVGTALNSLFYQTFPSAI
jgi:Flp pilus assembly pilin Flp